MLKLSIIMSENWNKETEEFEYPTVELELEHSLVALSKWESKHEKLFLETKEKTPEEVLDYIKCMVLTPDYPPEVFNKMTQEHADQIGEYIEAKMTATTVRNSSQPPAQSREKISAELIYYWMSSFQIPWEAENWHLNRLFALIQIFNAKQDQGKKKGPPSKSSLAERAAANERRKAELGTTG